MQIEGNNVSLRPFSDSDITSEYLSWLNDQDVVRYSRHRLQLHTVESCTKYYESFQGSPNLFFAIRDKENDQYLGTITAYISLQEHSADVGILIGRKSAWGCGFGQDAWNSLIEWLINERQIKTITAGTLEGNKAMIKLLRRSGMRLISKGPEGEIVDGKLEKMYHFTKP